VFDGGDEHRFALADDGHGIQRTNLNFAKPGLRYGLRSASDPSKLLIDPWAKELDRKATYHRDLARRGAETAQHVPKSVLATHVGRPFVRPHDPKWIYELPIRAFTRLHPDVPQEKRGTVAALAEPCVLDYFEHLGVDTIEFMPLTAWIDERHLHDAGLTNAWGYNPISFMAPDPRLAPGGMAEIATTLAALRQRGIQVLLDIVLNHSGEGDANGPTLSFRGLDDATWYRHHNGALINDTGCGNTIDLTQPVVVDYVVTALRHWVSLGFVGFRFDLATVMGRTPTGFIAHAPLITAIEQDPILKQCIMIAEPWDIGPGGYQLGHFPKRWFEWNDKYRDDVRRYWRGDAYSANGLATRLAGSSDVLWYKSPSRSINFIAAHDGFTLADLCRFSTKHNLANGEDNRDGKSDEVTCVGTDPNNLLATLFLSRGTPMLTAGDEFGRTQNGNNNAYAQDNETTWLNWNQRDQTRVAVVKQLIFLRTKLSLAEGDAFLTPSNTLWLDSGGRNVNWNDPSLRSMTLVTSTGEGRVAINFNGSDTDHELSIPPESGKYWHNPFVHTENSRCRAKSVNLFCEVEQTLI
jgi:glycogen debranching enzyme